MVTVNEAFSKKTLYNYFFYNYSELNQSTHFIFKYKYSLIIYIDLKMKSETDSSFLLKAPKISFRKPIKAASLFSLYAAKKPSIKVCDFLSSQITLTEQSSSLSTRCDSSDVDFDNSEESNCKSCLILEILSRIVSSKENEI